MVDHEKRITSYKFIRCFHQYVSLIFSAIFLNLISWKRKQTSYWSKTHFFLSLSVEKKNNKRLYKIFVDSEFEIGETTWWIRYLPKFLLILHLVIDNKEFILLMKHVYHTHACTEIESRFVQCQFNCYRQPLLLWIPLAKSGDPF